MKHEISLISIAMATYNGERFLAQQLESIVSQSYKNIEVVICDDGSTDQTLKIIQAYCDKYPFIKLYHNRQKLGFVKNFEKAISLCSGDYIALSDQDDIWIKEKLALQMKYMHKMEKDHPNSMVMVHSDLKMIDQNGNMIVNSYFKHKKYHLLSSKDLGHIFGPCGVMGNTIMINKRLKEMILPFPEAVKFHDYWIAVVNELLGHRATIEKSLVKYRIHDHNTSNTSQKLENTHLSFKFLTSFIHQGITPPFLSSHRADIIHYLLSKYKINVQDKIVILDFLTYLEGSGSKVKHIYLLLKHSLLKRDWVYRIAVIINYIFYNRKSKASKKLDELNVK